MSSREAVKTTVYNSFTRSHIPAHSTGLTVYIESTYLLNQKQRETLQTENHFRSKERTNQSQNNVPKRELTKSTTTLPGSIMEWMAPPVCRKKVRNRGHAIHVSMDSDRSGECNPNNAKEHCGPKTPPTDGIGSRSGVVADLGR